MRPTPAFWHERFRRQAAWTATLRKQAYATANAAQARRVLEVGSGTGVVLSELSAETHALRFGLDLDFATTAFAHRQDPELRLATGDGAGLPFPGRTFDIVLCHFLLLWVASQEAIMAEMVRVVAGGGWVLCLAEPDYGGRIDYPDRLAALGASQTHALAGQGADVFVGRSLRALLVDAGLTDVQGGVLGADWSGLLPMEEIQSEWATLEWDLGDLLPRAELDALRDEDLAAWREGRRTLYVPTFYAYGRKRA
jgi:SAM-dependent methyltransferase